jgi:chromosome segregation ATPase
MTADQTPAARTSPREQMLTDAEEHRHVISTQLQAAREQRDALTEELRKITAELQAKITAVRADIRDLVTEKEDAEALVKSLTPRTRKVQDVRAPVMHDPDHRAAAAVSAEHGAS